MKKERNENNAQVKIEIIGSAEFPWERVKDKVYPALAPSDWENVKKVPAARRDFLDLAVYYYIRVMEDDCMASIWVSEGILNGWGVGMDALDAQAMKNMKKVTYAKEMGEMIGAETLPYGPHILTNVDSHYGAAAMLDKESVFAFAAEKNADLYILPSSVHEVMLQPALEEYREKINAKNLNRMVRECNRMLVTPWERLADHIYHYSRETGEILIVE